MLFILKYVSIAGLSISKGCVGWCLWYYGLSQRVLPSEKVAFMRCLNVCCMCQHSYSTTRYLCSIYKGIIKTSDITNEDLYSTVNYVTDVIVLSIFSNYRKCSRFYYIHACTRMPRALLLSIESSVFTKFWTIRPYSVISNIWLILQS